MDYIGMFHDLLQENREKFGFLYHKKASKKETVIEVRTEGHLVLKVTEENEDYAYMRAYEDLELWIKVRNERISNIIGEFKRIWEENA